MSYIDMFIQAATPNAGPTNYLRVYMKADGLYIVDLAGVEYGPLLTNPLGKLNSLQLNTPTTKTIASGAFQADGNYHLVETEASASTDDVDTITQGPDLPDLLFLRPVASARNVVIKHGTGNIVLAGAADITLDLLTDHIMLLYDGTQWVDFKT